MTSTTTIRKSYGNRKLYTFPEDYPLKTTKQKLGLVSYNNAPKKTEDINKLIKYIDDNIVGKSNAFLGPFGRRKVVYCDYAASGRSLHFIEEYILREVLPSYGNTNTTTSTTSLQSSLFRQEAREIIKTSANAGESDAVIFSGHGCSDAIQKLISALDLREPPVVFTGPGEHHDNIHLWQDTGAQIVRISETKDGYLDLNHLESQLRVHSNNGGRTLIGCFSVASNVTGILADDIACTILLHQYNAFAFWDYNIAAPYINIDMNPSVPGVEENTNANKDAIYFSGHKFVGGIQTPGILIAKKSLFRKFKPCEGDGYFVSHEQNKSFEIQEEGSCAAIIESIRAGLVVQLKDAVTVANIAQRQEKINRQMLQHIRTIPEVILLGNNSPTLKRLPVFSFMVRHPRGLFLHHNFVAAVLNDIFGIQARAGCPCSGSYAQDLLGIDQSLADQYESIILEDRRLSSLNLGGDESTLELLRPGFTRISLPYFINESELAYIMEAVKMVATEGWKLLPQYIVDLETGEWRHYTNAVSKDRKWLSSIRYVDGKMTMNERRISGPGLFPQNYSECLQTARNLFNRARKSANRNPYNDQGITFDSRSEKIRWFMLQHEAQDLLTSNAQNVKQNVPFDPVSYSGSKRSSLKEKTADRADSPPQCVNPSSPRHYSYPSIDDPKLLSCSSPVPYFLHDVNGLYYPQIPQQQQVNFAVGETVSSNNLQLHQNFVRERCFSLGAPTVGSPTTLSPSSNRINAAVNYFRQRNLSCSSQNESYSMESDTNGSPTHSLHVGRGSPAPDLAYVTERTKELATNIKSEIREVISKVEDVLENTDMSFSSERHGSGSEDGRSDSISALEVAEYLEKVSIEMANEVKCEIRDVVSAVDVFITPDCQEKHCYSRASSYGEDTAPQYTPGSSSDTVINLITKDEPNEPHFINRIAPTTSAGVTSLSSQDSGINLSFHENDLGVGDFHKPRSSSESYGQKSKNHDVKFSTLQKQRPLRDNSDEQDGKIVESPTVRVSISKLIWQPFVEAIKEFEMIRNGDKVLICLSGGKDSLSLLHALLQYQNYVSNKGILFNLAVVSVECGISAVDYNSLMGHLNTLGVKVVMSQDNDNDNKEAPFETKENALSFSTAYVRHRLYSTAVMSDYNVLAIGQHLDDLGESFLLSLFHTGQLRTLIAHSLIKSHNLRVIRPFVYVREKYLRQFVMNHSLPVVYNPPSPNITKERQRIRQLLTQQEILCPKLFQCLRTAVQPLIGFQDEGLAVKTRKRSKSKDYDQEQAETEEEKIAAKG